MLTFIVVNEFSLLQVDDVDDYLRLFLDKVFKHD